MKIFDIVENVDDTIDFASSIDKEIVVKGMIQNLRVLGWGGFIILRAGRFSIQSVYDKNTINIQPDTLLVESAVKLTGIVKSATIKDKSITPSNYELHITAIEVLSTPSVSPLPIDTTKKEISVGLDTSFDLRPLSLRHSSNRALFKIQSVIFNEFGNFLSSNGFTRICTPKIVYSGAEGGANIFQLDYFGRNAYLAQSPQFYKQMMVGVFTRVFEEAPVFRAEKHDTSRHLNEYISLDLEMGFIESFYDIINMEVNLLNHIFNELKKQCSTEIQLLGIEMPSIDKIVVYKLSEVHELIFNEYKKDYRGEPDLAPEEEKLICEYVKKTECSDFVFVTHFPSEKRPFYTMDDPLSPKETLSFDLLFRGMEITTGGQRLHNYNDYISKMTKFGLNTNLFESYLQAFKFGMPPHGGLGLGLERLTGLLCGVSNVKEASLFPRDIKRLEP